MTDAALFKLLAQEDAADEDTDNVPQPETRNDENGTNIDEEKEALRQSGSKGLYKFYLQSVGWVRVLICVVLTGLAVFTESFIRTSLLYIQSAV